MTKNLRTWVIILLTAFSGLIAKDVYVFAKDIFWTVKNTPAQDKCINEISHKLDTVIEALEKGYVQKRLFTHHIRRDSALHADLKKSLLRYNIISR